MRNRFEEQLEELNVELIRMGALCEDAITYACRTLMGESQLAEEACRAEREIDQKERDIENLCMRLLLRQQPVARDLRQISSALKMISDMERIGDQASDIAEVSSFIQGNELESRLHILEMADATIVMVTKSIDSFVKKDLEIARWVIGYDDVVDELFAKVKREIVGLLGQGDVDMELSETCVDILMVAKYFERIGDHATNIAEWVEYSITGEHIQTDNHD